MSTDTYKILIADDNPVNLDLITRLLKKKGHEITTAENGNEVVDRFLEGSFDVILMDLEMPGISGIEVLTAMRERNDDTDVVVLTAHGSVEAAVEAIQGGAADFLLKPADFELVHNTESRRVNGVSKDDREVVFHGLRISIAKVGDQAIKPCHVGFD